ncbi:hypothetical protein [Haloferax sp. YSMS24]|uniref:DUF7322 domain-containing protein n=1 Tax=Haloferax sp. YSMS24 TaxID=3388425 RepID=UPI00398CDACB
MTDDERRRGDTEATESSSDATEPQHGARSADDVASPSDRVERWADPESRWGNPEKDLPNIPRVDIPGESGDESLQSEFSDDAPEFTADVDPEQTRLFWGAVVLANVGIAGVSLGVMLIYFRGQTLVGLGAVLLGIGALSRVYAIYREYNTTDWSADDDTSDQTADTDTDTDTDDERNR